MDIIVNGKIILTDKVIEGYNLAVQNGKIADIYKDKSKYSGNIIDAKGNYVSPGFIDIHVHGGGEGDFLDGNTRSIENILNTHTKHGTTGIFPTTLACDISETFDLIDNTNEILEPKKYYGKYAHILGLHLEGPYFSVSQRGAQDIRYIKDPDPEEYIKLLDYSNLVRRVTLAPELKGSMELIDELIKRDILPSIGHSDAQYQDVLEAYNRGATHVTHLYSGMQGVHRVNAYRRLGIVESAYLIDEMTVEVIADGKHLPVELLKLIYKLKGPDKIALVTDAMRAAGRMEGVSVLGSNEKGQKVILKDGVAFMPDFQSFAGSIATMDRLVRTMHDLVGIDICNSVKMASYTPARIMRCHLNKGSIGIGKDADIIIFDRDINILFVMLSGNTALSKL